MGDARDIPAREWLQWIKTLQLPILIYELAVQCITSSI